MKQLDVINAVKYWINNVVIELNFCPFAKKEFVNDRIDYQVCCRQSQESRLSFLESQLARLEKNNGIETQIIIYPEGLEVFENYLNFYDDANELIYQIGLEGVYQLASFHPDYSFEGVNENSASNYTNRSPYPMLHILREGSLNKVLMSYKNPQEIPEKNIQLAESLGTNYFNQILSKLVKQSHS